MFTVNPAPNTSWANTISANVVFCDAAIKEVGILPTQKNLKGASEDVEVLGKFVGAVGTTKTFWLNHVALGHDKRLIKQALGWIFGDESAGVLEWMIGEAKDKKVSVS